MSKPIKGSKEWFEQKKQARADLDLRLALGLPHSTKPLDAVVATIKTTNPPGAAATPKPPRTPRKKASKAAK